MKVIVRYLAQLRQAAGGASEVVDLEEGASLEQLLLRLGERHGGNFRRMLLDEGGALQPSILLFLDEDQVRPDACRPLRDNDEILVLSPMAGG